VETRYSAAGAIALLTLTAALAGCGSPASQLDEIQKKIDGLTATTRAIGESWLRGDVSPTFARTAFLQTLRLLDDQRTSLTESPQLLLDPRGAALSRRAEQLSRVLAALVDAARQRDDGAAREHLSRIRAGETSP